MKILCKGGDPQPVLEGLRLRGSGVLMLDYDGTLAPFRENRHDAVPFEGVAEQIAAMLQAGASRVVVVSGRRAVEIRQLLGIDPAPVIWGSHGWEKLAPGRPVQTRALPKGVESVLRTAREAAIEWGTARLESKPAGLAFHTRDLPDAIASTRQNAVYNSWKPLTAGLPLDLHPFDGGLELRVSGWNKGDVVKEIMAESGEGATLAYLGDDLTDEDAFQALDGMGLTVLVRKELRATRARLWLTPPAELISFLSQWSRACQGIQP